jgi:hypothetical protein
VPWATSSDVGDFLAAAGDFLYANPVDHTVLLTEAAYLSARPSTATDQLYGWWKPPGGAVAGAFLRAPKHPPILSTMPGEAVQSLVDVLEDTPAVGVDGRLVDTATTAWRRLRPHSRITLYRLGNLRVPQPQPGKARVATAADRDLLVSWFHRLMAAYPDDPSEVGYVVDDPISYGGITLWEVDGIPTAMAGRSRLVAGMVRLSAVYAPQDPGDGDAAFVAACVAAREVASEVLVFGSGYRELGFEPVLDRVMLRA